MFVSWGKSRLPPFAKTWWSPQRNESFNQEMQLKIPLLSRVLESSNSKSRCRVSACHFFLWNRCPQWLSDTELNQMNAFSASYSRIKACFTAWKQTGVWNSHATRGHGISTTFTSIVYFMPLSSPWCWELATQTGKYTWRWLCYKLLRLTRKKLSGALSNSITGTRGRTRVMERLNESQSHSKSSRVNWYRSRFELSMEIRPTKHAVDAKPTLCCHRRLWFFSPLLFISPFCFVRFLWPRDFLPRIGTEAFRMKSHRANEKNKCTGWEITSQLSR